MCEVRINVQNEIVEDTRHPSDNVERTDNNRRLV